MNISHIHQILRAQVKKASRHLASLKDDERNRILVKIARGIEHQAGEILKANKIDVSKARRLGKSEAFIDRLTLTKERISVMASQVRVVASLKTPLGNVIKEWKRPNGLLIKKISVPIGIIFIIYESRPNVTSDSAALCLKSGNATVLRGGSDSIASNRAIYGAIAAALPKNLKEAVFFVDDTNRETVKSILRMNDCIDAVIPRGGEGLIKSVLRYSRIPVIYHGKGVCNLYIDKDADFEMALKIALNAKVQRPGVCNAIEKLLVARPIAGKILPLIFRAFKKEGVSMRGCPATLKILPRIKRAKEADWDEEYLDKIIAIKIVDGVNEAADFINAHGSHLSDAIVTKSAKTAKTFFSTVDSACLYHNASTRFTDGGEFGMGAEIGISNQKLHARGPVGVAELTSYKYIVYGTGQIRE